MKRFCFLSLLIFTLSCNDIGTSIENKSSVYDSIKIGHLYQGGIIYFIDSFQKIGLIAADKDFKELGWPEALDACQHFRGGQYSDWHLPNIRELNILKKMKDTVGGFVSEGYWSSSYDSAIGYGNDTVYLPYYQYFRSIKDFDHYVWRGTNNEKEFGVRPVRSFSFNN